MEDKTQGNTYFQVYTIIVGLGDRDVSIPLGLISQNPFGNAPRREMHQVGNKILHRSYMTKNIFSSRRKCVPTYRGRSGTPEETIMLFKSLGLTSQIYNTVDAFFYISNLKEI